MEVSFQSDLLYTTIYLTKFRKLVAGYGKSLVWEEKIVGAATIVADSRV